MECPVRTGKARNSSSRQPVDLITSNESFHLFEDLQDGTYSSKATSLPRLPRPIAPSSNKKRDLDHILASSSDAPLFSSDDLLASTSENYLHGHRDKRLHRRNWYEESGMTIHRTMHPPEHHRLRGPFSRNYDSGVWLSSDASNKEDQDRTDVVRKTLRIVGEGGSIDCAEIDGLDLKNATLSGTPTPEDLENAALYRKALQTIEDPGDFEGAIFPYWGKQPEQDVLRRFHIAQKDALDKVMKCVETGGEVVDLSFMNLLQIRTLTLKPLRDYVRQAPGYQRLTPALRLYLSNNSLEEVPGEVYHLQNLEALSLRNNILTEILPSIKRLIKLRELNVGSNQLRWLPYELLELLIHSTLQICRIYPNPLIRPMPSVWKYHSYRAFDSEKPCPVASTVIAFLDITGGNRRDSPPAPSSLPEHWAEAAENEALLRPPPEEQKKTPSLVEIALRACYKSPQLSQLPFLLPEEDCPFHLSPGNSRKQAANPAPSVTVTTSSHARNGLSGGIARPATKQDQYPS